MDEKFMQRCIDLARCGEGSVSPNPMVGAVITHNGKIIGEGWHKKCGEPHAEVNAVNSVKDKSLLCEATIYVSLEPCAHVGRTPACADMLIRERVKNVVVGSIDPFEKVAGKGIQKLKNAGIEVKVGVLKAECDWLNRRFFTFHTQKRPYIILKWAETADGYIDNLRTSKEQKPLSITNDFYNTLNHKRRSVEDAILVGANTVLLDNPQLSSRNWSQSSPIRVCFDRDLSLSTTCNIFNNKATTIIFNEKQNLVTENFHYHKIDFSKDVVNQVLNVLYDEQIQSVIVEGGSKTLSSFIENNCWDEAHVFTSQQIIGSGVKSPDFHFKHQVLNCDFGQMHKIYYKNEYYKKKINHNAI